MGVAEYATLVTVEKESSVRNTVSFNTEKLDATLADTQYTKFKVRQVTFTRYLAVFLSNFLAGSLLLSSKRDLWQDSLSKAFW
jgi:hypothetical protein